MKFPSHKFSDYRDLLLEDMPAPPHLEKQLTRSREYAQILENYSSCIEGGGDCNHSNPIRWWVNSTLLTTN